MSDNTSTINDTTAHVEFCYRWNCKYCGHANRTAEIKAGFSNLCEGCGEAIRIVEIVQFNGDKMRIG